MHAESRWDYWQMRFVVVDKDLPLGMAQFPATIHAPDFIVFGWMDNTSYGLYKYWSLESYNANQAKIL